MLQEKAEKEIEVEVLAKATVTIDIFKHDQFFTHKDPDGALRHFPTDCMYRFAEKIGHACVHVKRVNVTMKSFPIDFIRENMGIEQRRLDRLIEPYLSRPCLAIQWPPSKEYPEGTMTLIDGNHRVVKFSEMGGVETLKCYLFEKPLWEKFLIELPNYDEADMKKESKILEIENTVRV